MFYLKHIENLKVFEIPDINTEKSRINSDSRIITKKLKNT